LLYPAELRGHMSLEIYVAGPLRREGRPALNLTAIVSRSQAESLGGPRRRGDLIPLPFPFGIGRGTDSSAVRGQGQALSLQ